MSDHVHGGVVGFALGVLFVLGLDAAGRKAGWW